MKYSEACKILGVSEEVSPEEAKKKYRQLSKTMHPDVNKDPDATEKFKQINEAYSVVSSGKKDDEQAFNGFNPFDGFIDLNPFIGNFKKSKRVVLQEVSLNIDISFKESVLGCKKEIKFNRRTKCEFCRGAGTIRLDNGCAKCKGKGVVMQQQNNMIFTTTCNSCHGQTKSEDCKQCTDGAQYKDTSISVTIPPGVQSGNVLRLNGMGHYIQSNMNFDNYTNAFLHIKVIPEDNLYIKNDNVYSDLNISLLEALQGTTKEINTIFGKKTLEIKPLTKNKDELNIPNCGIAGKKDQIVCINVYYPENVEKIINTLKE